MLNRRSDKLELLRIAEAVALEKSIDKELIIDSMETGIAKAAKSKFGQDNEIKVLIDRDSGEIGIFRKLIITENPENTNTEINLQDAIILNEVNKDKKIGDEILQPLPSFDSPLPAASPNARSQYGSAHACGGCARGATANDD